MSETRNTGGATWRNNPSASASAQQAYDPWLQPELFRGVLTKRVFAFLIDLVILSIPIVLAIIFIMLIRRLYFNCRARPFGFTSHRLDSVLSMIIILLLTSWAKSSETRPSFEKE